jgi:hypothetical protein
VLYLCNNVFFIPFHIFSFVDLKHIYLVLLLILKFCMYFFVTLLLRFIIISILLKQRFHKKVLSWLVIGTSRTVGSAKKFVRITSGFGGGEFTKTLRKVCTSQKLKFAFLQLEYCKIRECYAVANAFTIRNMYRLLLYM